MERLFVDVTFTRTQKGNIGITRTVRQLLKELGKLSIASGKECWPVAHHNGGYRIVESIQAHNPDTCASGANRNYFFRKQLEKVAYNFARKAILLSLHILPWSVLYFFWQLTSNLLYSYHSLGHKSAKFEDGDVVLVADAAWHYPSWQSARRAHTQGASIVLLIYDLMPLRRPEFCFALVPHLFDKWLQEMLEICDAVVCISHATEKDLKSWVASKKSIGNFPPVGHFRLGSDISSPKIGETVRDGLRVFLDDDGPCFSAIGTFEPKKNYPLLLTVFDQLWADGFRIKLLIAGRRTNDCADLLRRIDNHPKNGTFLLCMDDASDAEIAKIYESSRALIFPSLFEGFGLPLVEARSRGCIVIASKLPAFEELADNGVFLFPEGDFMALKAAIISHFYDDRRGEVGSMKSFTWGDSAQQCNDLFETLLR